MSVLVRSKRVQSTHERRQTPAHHAAARPAQPGPSPAEHRHREHHRSDTRRLSNDEALYNCQCGFVFAAPVSTSVGCPHCGGTQAW